MADDSAATVLSREVKRALSAARLSVPAASVKLGWDRKRLYRWIDGSVSPRIEDVEVFARAVGPVTLQIGGHEEEAPPEWAGQLAEMVADKVVERLATGELPVHVAGRLAERLGLPQPQAGEGAPERTPKPRGGATRAPRRKE